MPDTFVVMLWDAQVSQLDEQARSTCLLIACHNSSINSGQFLCDALRHQIESVLNCAIRMYSYRN